MAALSRGIHSLFPSEKAREGRAKKIINQLLQAGRARTHTLYAPGNRSAWFVLFSAFLFLALARLMGGGERKGGGPGYTTLTHGLPPVPAHTHGLTSWEQLAASRPSWTRINLPYLVAGRALALSLFLFHADITPHFPPPPTHKDDQAFFPPPCLTSNCCAGYPADGHPRLMYGPRHFFLSKH